MLELAYHTILPENRSTFNVLSSCVRSVTTTRVTYYARVAQRVSVSVVFKKLSRGYIWRRVRWWWRTEVFDQLNSKTNNVHEKFKTMSKDMGAATEKEDKTLETHTIAWFIPSTVVKSICSSTSARHNALHKITIKIFCIHVSRDQRLLVKESKSAHQERTRG